MKNQNNNNGCGCDCHPQPAPVPPVDINMGVCDRNMNMLPMLQTYTTKVLKPNVNGCCKKNILTQGMLSCENYKYVIKWDFDLNGQTITVPENCILEFDGGSLKNGTIVGQDTVFINVGDVDIWGERLTREGTWREHSGGGGSSEEDKPYDPEHFSGLGKKFLRLNPDGSNILTQEDFDQSNTIYVVGYDFDLDGAEINVPSDCVIDFDGGSVNNGTFRLNSATIEGEPKGTALYGVGYKDKEALLQNYKRKYNVSQVNDFAFLLWNSSILWHQRMTSQSLCVSEDYLFFFGTSQFDDNPDYKGKCMITLFDRNFNMLGQCRCPELGHASDVTIVEEDIYCVPGESGSYIKKVHISDIVNACTNSTKDNIQVIAPYDTVSIADKVTACIDYDADREEFAVVLEEGNDITNYVDVYLAVYDKELNLIKDFSVDSVDFNQYIINNYLGKHGITNIHYLTPQCVVYSNGIVYVNYSAFLGNTSTDSVYSFVVEVDGNTGLPVQCLGLQKSMSGQSECEGIAKDPSDDDVFWSVITEQFCYQGEYYRQPACYFSRISFNKELCGLLAPDFSGNDNKLVSRSSEHYIYVDNTPGNSTLISTGNPETPFKTLETAMLIAGNCEHVIFFLKATDIPYTLPKIPITQSVTITRYGTAENNPTLVTLMESSYDNIKAFVTGVNLAHSTFSTPIAIANDNLLRGSGSMTLNTEIAYDVDGPYWKIAGGSNPTVIDVSFANYPLIKKAYYLNNSGSPIKYLKFPAGTKELTVSLFGKLSDDYNIGSTISGKMGIYITYYREGSDEEVLDMIYVYINMHSWKQYSATFVLPDNYDSSRICSVVVLRVDNGPVICGIKAEQGHAPTLWTPHADDVLLGGPTSKRPINVEIGYHYFDTDENKDIVWGGTDWVNPDGSPLT